MRETSILIKPASSSCNLVCSYCFYDDVSNCRDVKSYGLIQEKTWKKLVDDAFQSQNNYDKVNFLFQGGEPLVAGYRFFETFVNYTEETKGSIQITYAVQTNGTKLDHKFCTLFKKYGFLIGISIDGFEENHNKVRMISGSGSFKAVMNGFQLIKEYDLDYSVLTVLTKQLAKEPKRLYSFYRDHDIPYVQLIPCLPSFGKRAEDDLFACTPQLFASFYKEFYRLWTEDVKRGRVFSESLIDNILTIFSGGYPERCGMLGTCQSQCIVEANGNIYPCDFYVLDEYIAGNINDESLDSISKSTIMDTFKTDFQTPEKACVGCKFAKICNGNCKRMRENFISDDYCGYKELLQTVMDSYPDLIQTLTQ